jgi:DNA-binding MarR family transcriptional regulator
MADSLVEDTSQHMLALLPLLNRLVATEVRREVGEAVSVLQLRVLITLLDEARTLSSLAREYHVSPQALCDVAHNLVERGWLARTPLPHDRRQHLLAITDVGRVAYLAARERAMQQITLLLGDLSQPELEAVQTALPALHRVLARLERNG